MPQGKGQAWASDITVIKTREDWRYLATVIELYSRRIIGWSVDKRMQTTLVAYVLDMGVRQGKPAGGALIHPDRRSQYRSEQYQRQLKQYGLISCSMSGKGCRYDNAVMESFYHTLKTELAGRNSFLSRTQASHALFDDIEVFYNRRRKHSTLGYLSLVEYGRLNN